MPIISIVARRRGDQLTTAGKPSTWFPAGALVERRLTMSYCRKMLSLIQLMTFQAFKYHLKAF